MAWLQPLGADGAGFDCRQSLSLAVPQFPNLQRWGRGYTSTCSSGYHEDETGERPDKNSHLRLKTGLCSVTNFVAAWPEGTSCKPGDAPYEVQGDGPSPTVP